jgi:hypothetical protein
MAVLKRKNQIKDLVLDARFIIMTHSAGPQKENSEK